MNHKQYINKQHSEKYKKQSKERFFKIAEKKIKTSFIGALDQFEREFGYVWGHGEEQPTMEQQEMRKVWEKVRNNILNNGNNQIRNLETEMEYYTMEWNRYHYDLPVKG